MTLSFYQYLKLKQNSLCGNTVEFLNRNGEIYLRMSERGMNFH
jgi:hypothetical protein